MGAKSKLLALTAVVAIWGCSATRPPGPPVGAERVLPRGAVTGLPEGPAHAGSLEGRIHAGLEQLGRTNPERQSRNPTPYRILALSGGGSRGAFAAGFLAGWSEAGTRPQFDVVTGISTGALMATFAFLGPDYDDRLRVYTRVRNADIYEAGTMLRAITASSLHDTTPMRALIATLVTDQVLEAVAREHAAGRRLFVGTTNLESGQFTIWDMGAIASSNWPDRIERYRDVVLAAVSFPVMFPPVYIPVEIDGETYWEAHIDGAARASVFARVFMLDVEDLLERVNGDRGELRGALYVIRNIQPPQSKYGRVLPSIAGVAERSVDTMLYGVTVYSSDALFRMAMFTGTEFHETWIPSNVEYSGSPLEFDPDEMSRLFEIGRRMARSERPFIVHFPAPSEPADLLEVIDPDETYDFDFSAYERAAGIH